MPECDGQTELLSQYRVSAQMTEMNDKNQRELENLQCEAQQAYSPWSWNIVVCTWSKSVHFEGPTDGQTPFVVPKISAPAVVTGAGSEQIVTKQ